MTVKELVESICEIKDVRKKIMAERISGDTRILNKSCNELWNKIVTLNKNLTESGAPNELIACILNYIYKDEVEEWEV